MAELGSLMSRLPPGLGGYVLGQQEDQATQRNNLSMLMGMSTMQHQGLQNQQLQQSMELAKQELARKAKIPGMFGLDSPNGVSSAGGSMDMLAGTGLTREDAAKSLIVDPSGKELMVHILKARLEGTKPQTTAAGATAWERGPDGMPKILLRVPQGEPGVDFDMTPQGKVTSAYGIPGYAAAKSGQTRATEAAKGEFDMVNIEIPNPDQSPGQPRTITRQVTKTQASQLLGGQRGQPDVPSADIQGDLGTALRLIGNIRDPAERDAAYRAYVTNNRPGSMQGFVDPAQQGAQRQVVPGLPVQSAASKAGGVATAEHDAKWISELPQKQIASNNTLRFLNRLEVLNADDKTYAAAGAEFKAALGRIAESLGIDDPAIKDKTANTDQYIATMGELIKARLASKDYGSGTGVSNLDTITATLPLPELAKSRQGRQQIIEALRADTQSSLNDYKSAREHFYGVGNNSLRGWNPPSEANNATTGLPEKGTPNPVPGSQGMAGKIGGVTPPPIKSVSRTTVQELAAKRKTSTARIIADMTAKGIKVED